MEKWEIKTFTKTSQILISLFEFCASKYLQGFVTCSVNHCSCCYPIILRFLIIHYAVCYSFTRSHAHLKTVVESNVVYLLKYCTRAQIWGTCTILEYFYVVQLHTSMPLHLRGSVAINYIYLAALVTCYFSDHNFSWKLTWWFWMWMFLINWNIKFAHWKNSPH